MPILRSVESWLGDHLTPRLAAGLVAAAAGTVFLLVAVETWRGQQPIPGGVVTTGEIVGFEEVRPEGGGSPLRYPVVEFKANRDSTQRFTIESHDQTSRKGYRVDVRYDPDDPKRAQPATPPDKLLWAVFGGLGALLWFTALALWLWGRLAARRGQASPPG